MAFIEIKDDVYINVNQIVSVVEDPDTNGSMITVLDDVYYSNLAPYQIRNMIRQCGITVVENQY